MWPHQKVASGLTGLPVPPSMRSGATVKQNSQRRSRKQVAARRSRSQLSNSHSPIATIPIEWIGSATGTPHVVPGSDATQWYWGTHYDISTVNPRF